MHNFSNCRIFSRDIQLELDNLWLTDLMDTGKPKFSCYHVDQQDHAQFESSIGEEILKQSEKFNLNYFKEYISCIR